MNNANLKDITNCLRVSLKDIKYDLAQNIASYMSPPTLECIALTRIAISIWQHDDNRAKIARAFDSHDCIFVKRHLYYEYLYWWSPIEKEVVRNVSCLEMPINCRMVLKGMVKQVGQQILKYLFSQNFFPWNIHDRIEMSNYAGICWTYQGAINNLKTINYFLEKTDLSTLDKYIVACNYCLEEKIQELHDQLPENFIEAISNRFLTQESFINLGISSDCYDPLVLFWTYHLRGTQEKFYDIIFQKDGYVINDANNNDYILQCAIRANNGVAVQYIWRNLADEEMKRSLVDNSGLVTSWKKVKFIKDFVVDLDSFNILFYLMLHMKDKQIEELCDENIYEFLQELLDDWKWHDVFLPTAKFALQYINTMDNEEALNILLRWKESVFERGQRKRLFSEIDVGDKIKFMYDEGLDRCRVSIQRGKVCLLDVFLRGILATDKDVEEFKEHVLLTRGVDFCLSLIELGEYERADDFLKIFCAKEKIGRFKLEFAYGIGNKRIRLENGSKENKFTKWCFDGNEVELALHTATLF